MRGILKPFFLLIVVSIAALTPGGDRDVFGRSSGAGKESLSDRGDRAAGDYDTVKGSKLLPQKQSCFSRLTAHSTVVQQLNAIVQLKGLNFPPPQTRGRAKVPLKLLEGSRVFTVELTLGNLPGEFLLDTGASTTLVSTPTVQKLGLVGEKIPSERLTSAVAGDECPEMSANVHELPTLAVDGVRVERLRGLELTSTQIPGELSGVLGMDVLRHFDLKINPQTRQLELLPPSEPNPNPTQQAIPLKSHLGVMLAEIEINGKGPFTFMLDTGADTIFISHSLANILQLSEASRQEIQVIGFCGLEDAELSTLERVKIQQHQQSNLEAVILSSPSVLDLLEVDGILGQSFFNRYEQYWRFGSTDSYNNFGGSLILTPFGPKSEN